MTEPEAIEEPQKDLHRAIVRIVAGGIGEGIDRLLAVSAELDDADVDPTDGPTSIQAPPNVMAFVGWTSELPELVHGIGGASYRMTYPLARAAAVTIDTAAYIAEATGVASFVAGATEPVRTAIAEELERLTAVGTAEYARGRVLATYAFEQSVNGVVGLLSESDELGELVREQTIGITGSAVQEIRETGAAADGLTENLFRKMVGRSRRQLPPAPAGEKS
jgi:hypothetical protein